MSKQLPELDQPRRYSRTCRRRASFRELERADDTRRLSHALRQSRSSGKSREVAPAGLRHLIEPRSKQGATTTDQHG